MDYKSLLSFLLNNRILETSDIFAGDFSLEKREGSNLSFIINRRVKSDTKYMVKTLRNTNSNNTLLLREAKFFEYFHQKNLFPSFPKLINKGLYMNNSIFVREYLEPYVDSVRILKSSNPPPLDLIPFIESIAKKLFQFHNFSINGSDLLKSLEGSFERSEIEVFPIVFQEVPPLQKFKFQPFYIQQFWNILNEPANKTKVNEWLKVINSPIPDKKLIHGDFSLKNILFNQDGLPKTDDYFFIDFEQWHLGDPVWDIATFFDSLQELLPQLPSGRDMSIKKIKEHFFNAYFSPNQPNSNFVDKTDIMQRVRGIQNAYFGLLAGGMEVFAQEIQRLTKILAL